MKDIVGSTITITADEGPTLLATSLISLTTKNGTYGEIDMTANPGYLDALGGLINMTANGGNANGGLYGAVNIVANPGTEQTTGITTGGLVTITANSGNLDLPTATSAIKINASGVNSYAGAIPAIGSLAGYNFMYGTGGVNICAGLPSVFPQIPLTTYLYGTAGIVLNSDVYTTDVYPYWNGLAAPANLTIHGRTTISGSASVVLSNVSSIAMEGGGAITGVNFINGSAYPPTTTVPPNLSLSTLTMNPTGYISTNTIVNGGIKIDMGYGIPNVLSLTYPTGTSGYVNILEQGYGAGVLKVGAITNLSSINGVTYPAGLSGNIWRVGGVDTIVNTTITAGATNTLVPINTTASGIIAGGTSKYHISGQASFSVIAGVNSVVSWTIARSTAYPPTSANSTNLASGGGLISANIIATSPYRLSAIFTPATYTNTASFSVVDTPPAGTYWYSLWAYSSAVNAVTSENVVLTVLQVYS
jgi:hypothetical protein